MVVLCKIIAKLLVCVLFFNLKPLQTMCLSGVKKKCVLGLLIRNFIYILTIRQQFVARMLNDKLFF